MAEDLKGTLAVWDPRDPRVLRGSLGNQDLWEKEGQLAPEAFQVSKAQRAALALEDQGGSQAPKGMWDPQDQRGPQGLQDLQGLRESQGFQERQGHQASGGPQGLRVNQASRVPLDYLDLQVHQGTGAPTEKSLWPDAAMQAGEGGSEKAARRACYLQSLFFDPNMRVSLKADCIALSFPIMTVP